MSAPETVESVKATLKTLLAESEKNYQNDRIERAI